MGVLFSNDRQIGDDGKCAVLPEGLLRTLMADDAERQQRAAVATAKVLADSDEASRSAAVRLAAHLIENAADRYERWPAELYKITGLAPWSSPEQIIAVCDSIRESRIRRFGEEVEPINRAGARRYAERMIAASAVAAE